MRERGDYLGWQVSRAQHRQMDQLPVNPEATYEGTHPEMNIVILPHDTIYMP